MKQITYKIRGLVIETMIPAIVASCESLGGVKNVRVSVRDTDTATITLILEGEPTETLETDLSCIMRAKGLELTLPAVVEELPNEPTSAIPADRPTEQPSGADSGNAVHYVTAPPPKEGKKVGLTAAVSTVLVSVVLAILLTFSLTTSYMKHNPPQSVTPGQSTAACDRLEIIDRLFRSATVLELDEKALITGVLKGYVAATGDVYAEYFTAEEYEEQTSANNGEMCGIGVKVGNAVLSIDGVDCQVITIANVYPDSPAEEAGLLPGDHIVSVGVGEDATRVHDIGYTEALARLKGAEGTACAFTVYRKPAGSSEETDYEEIDVTATRRKLTTRSVTYRRYTEDETVGIIRLTGFDNTTRDQFTEAVEALKTQGCQSFVLDLRGNPGGLLTAVEDVLVFFLQEGDTIITTENAKGEQTVTRVAVGDQGKLLCGTGELTREDIGKYRDLSFSVLVNGYSASAAELFTANIRDYALGKIVGTTTYGKGCGQTTYSLSRYGYEGALKLTTFYYYPPCGEGYDGIGIPPHVEVELSEEAMKYNINLLPDALDNQLAEAVRNLK